jgi:hypothetical protein
MFDVWCTQSIKSKFPLNLANEKQIWHLMLIFSTLMLIHSCIFKVLLALNWMFMVYACDKEGVINYHLQYTMVYLMVGSGGNHKKM